MVVAAAPGQAQVNTPAHRKQVHLATVSGARSSKAPPAAAWAEPRVQKATRQASVGGNTQAGADGSATFIAGSHLGLLGVGEVLRRKTTGSRWAAAERRQQRRQSAVEQRGGRQAMERCHRVCSDATGHVGRARMRAGQPVKAMESAVKHERCRAMPAAPPSCPANPPAHLLNTGCPLAHKWQARSQCSQGGALIARRA